MSRRSRSNGRNDEPQPSAAQGAACTPEFDERTGTADEAQQALKALAEYFALLRQWELNSRSDDDLAPDSIPTEQP